MRRQMRRGLNLEAVISTSDSGSRPAPDVQGPGQCAGAGSPTHCLLQEPVFGSGRRLGATRSGKPLPAPLSRKPVLARVGPAGHTRIPVHAPATLAIDNIIDSKSPWTTCDFNLKCAQCQLGRLRRSCRSCRPAMGRNRLAASLIAMPDTGRSRHSSHETGAGKGRSVCRPKSPLAQRA